MLILLSASFLIIGLLFLSIGAVDRGGYGPPASSILVLGIFIVIMGAILGIVASKSNNILETIAS